MSLHLLSGLFSKEAEKEAQLEGLLAVRESWSSASAELGLFPEQSFSEDPGWQQLQRVHSNLAPQVPTLPHRMRTEVEGGPHHSL